MSRRDRRRDRKRQEKTRKEDRAENREQRRIQEAFNQHGELDRDWMEEVLGVDDLKDALNEYQLRKIQGLVNKQWLLGNLTEAQTHDRWYKLEVMKYKILGSFPPPESAIQGPIRAFLYDDEYERLESLTAEERNAFDQIITSLQNMVTRSKEGWERKQANTKYARTDREQIENESSGGRLSIFGG